MNVTELFQTSAWLDIEPERLFESSLIISGIFALFYVLRLSPIAPWKSPVFSSSFRKSWLAATFLSLFISLITGLYAGTSLVSLSDQQFQVQQIREVCFLDDPHTFGALTEQGRITFESGQWKLTGEDVCSSKLDGTKDVSYASITGAILNKFDHPKNQDQLVVTSDNGFWYTSNHGKTFTIFAQEFLKQHLAKPLFAKFSPDGFIWIAISTSDGHPMLVRWNVATNKGFPLYLPPNIIDPLKDVAFLADEGNTVIIATTANDLYITNDHADDWYKLISKGKTINDPDIQF